VFDFIERRLRHERQFKRAILLVTGLAIILIFKAVPWGPSLSFAIDTWARRTFGESLRVSRSRAQIDESWRDYRRSGIELTRPHVERFYAESNPEFQRLLRYAGMDPAHGLLRWGNFNWTMLLSSKVFEPDDNLSYRLRPRVRSIWLQNMTNQLVGTAFYLVPDGPGLAEAIRGTSAIPLETSRQFTNSWGLRGPEPELDAPLRVLVLGDSFMQGMFIGDEETPPECLRRYLARELKTRVSVLNAGVMGYSPEQYYYSLPAFGDRFQPQFVVVSIFANDFGNMIDATNQGVGDWREGKYWLERIFTYCTARHWPYLIVPAPYDLNLLKKRKSGNYPGMLNNLLNIESRKFLDPMEDFLNAHVKSRNAARREGRALKGSALFNNEFGDGHFSLAGSEVWAESIGRRLILLLEEVQVFGDEEPAGRDDPRLRAGAADAPQAEAGPS
jgi:hypothetical protein